MKQLKDSIKSAYLQDSRPWIIGFSGGKDSTFMADLIIESLNELPKDQLTKRVHIITGDTQVEAPNVIAYIYRTIEKMRKSFVGTIFSIDVVKPKLHETFWSLLIGKGYPAPVKSFRWCTDRMKIQPSNDFIQDRISESGEVVICLGVRNEEGATRKKSIAEHSIEGGMFGTHSTMKNALTFMPIKDVTKEQLWNYMIKKKRTEWGQSATELYALYKSADRDCPLVIDKFTPSCGGNRFGCWTCTVISKDRSMEGFVESGEEQFRPLLEFRNFLQVSRNDLRMRSTSRRNGTDGTGPYTFAARQMILKKLLWTQEQVGDPLISLEEIDTIEQQWRDDGWIGDMSSVLDGSNPEYDRRKAVYQKNGVIDIDLFNMEEVQGLESIRV